MKRRSILATVCGAAAGALGAILLMVTHGQKDGISKIAVGTYGEHIYTYEFNHHTNEFVQTDKTHSWLPSYLSAQIHSYDG